jgi:hypothetical protein
MLARMLEQLGLFTGVSKDQNSESQFFQEMNRWIFGQVGATWDNPYSFRFMNDYLRGMIGQVLEHQSAGQARQVFIGRERMDRFAHIRDLDMPWGWKDPRNSFTVELWARVFPGLRVIHIYRNPVDVAASLHARAQKEREWMSSRVASAGIAAALAGNVQFQKSLRIEHLDEGVKLWEEYTGRALRVCEEFGEHALSIRYEDFLADPEKLLTAAAAFSGLDVAADRIRDVAKEIKNARRYAFVNSPELMALHERVRDRPLVERLGYGQIGLEKDRCFE